MTVFNLIGLTSLAELILFFIYIIFDIFTDYSHAKQIIAQNK